MPWLASGMIKLHIIIPCIVLRQQSAGSATAQHAAKGHPPGALTLAGPCAQPSILSVVLFASIGSMSIEQQRSAGVHGALGTCRQLTPAWLSWHA